MNTPVISKRQQKQTLASIKKSAKKTPAKGLRNVLAQPYDRYWPVVKAEDGSVLEVLLDKLLPGIKRQSISIPWGLLRKMAREERLAAQKKARMDAQMNCTDNKELKSVTMGVNAVTRDLEKENLCSVLLDSNVESLLIKHVVVMAHDNSIPVVLVPFLKKATLEHIGFASAAMGLKTTVVDAGHSFHKVHEEIVRLSLAINSAIKIVLPDEPKIGPTIETNEMFVEEVNAPADPPFTLSTSIYKYRSNRKERSFVPPTLTDKTVDNQKEWGDFISIGKDDETMETGKRLFACKNGRYVDIHAKVPKKSAEKNRESDEFIAFGSRNDETSPRGPKKRKIINGTYVPLKVKRIQGNNNRVKATKAPKQKKKVLVNKS